MKLTGLFFILTFFSSLSCSRNFSVRTSSEKDSVEIAKQVLKYIESSEVDSFKMTINKEVLNSVEESELMDFCEEAKYIILNSVFPSDSMIQSSTSLNFRINSTYKLEILSFPFKNSNSGLIKYIVLVFSDNEIMDFAITEYKLGLTIIEPEVKEKKHLASHTLKVSDVNWFRVWYGSGFKENEYGDSYGYYAIEGNREKLTECNNLILLEEIFDLINEAKIDSTDYASSFDYYEGNPEFVLFRFKFDSYPYNSLGEFKILFMIDEDPTRKEEEVHSKYILLFHSGRTRYLINKQTNPRLVEKILEFTLQDYGDYQETRTY